MRIKAQITIYAALSFMLVITLVCTCIKSAVRSQTDVDVNMAARLSVESVFAEYSKDLLEEFDVFALKDGDNLDIKLKKYVMGNLCKLSNAEYIYSEFNDKSYITDNNGASVEKQVVEYMRIGAAAEVLKDEEALRKENEKSQRVKEIADDIVSCEEELFKIDAKLLEIISLVEGIKTSESGLVIRSGKAVATGEYFAKALVTQDLSMKTAAIDSAQVYNAVSGIGTRYKNVNSLLQDMADDIEIFMEYKTDGDEDGADNCKRIYQNNYKLLTDIVTETYDKTKAALQKVNDYYQVESTSDISFEKCVDKTNNSKEILGDELAKSFLEDLDTMFTHKESNKKKLCDIAIIESGLKSNKKILEKAIATVDVLKLNENTDYEVLIRNIKECKDIFLGLSNEALRFDYSSIDFSQEAEGLTVIETLKETLENGICGLVLTEEVSTKSINYTDLANTLYDEGNRYSVNNDDESNSSLIDRALFNEYIISRFPNYMDTKGKEGVTEKKEADWCALDYPLEYVLCGNSTDKDNINEVILKLSAMREGVNLAHLIVDTTKKNEAMALATTMVGFTGNIAVVKVVQYLILTVWAYGESICDLRSLFKGERIPVVKTKKEWKLSLSNLMKMQFDSGESEDNKENNSIFDGTMGYEDYLKVLLVLSDSNEKRMNLLSAMELRMIALGNSDFRMQKYIASAVGTVTVRRKDYDTFSSRDVRFSY